MDTVRNVVNLASNAIFGSTTEQSGSEPVSGQRGAGTANDPYDQGNADYSDGSPPQDSSTPQDSTPSAPKTTSTNSIDTTNDRMSSNPTTGDPSSGQHPFQEQKGADRTAEGPTNPAENQAVQETKQDAESAQQADTNDSDNRQQQGFSAGDKDVASRMVGEAKHPKTEEERQEMAAKGQLPKIPGDHSGEPMRMHSGPRDGDGAVTDPNAGEKGRAASVGQEGGGEHGKEKGTGEKYVRSTGTAADGGDFDATKPGAGREANRLLEEKGVHKTKSSERKGGDHPGEVNQPSASSEPSKVEKLKEKLHIGTGKLGNEQSV